MLTSLTVGNFKAYADPQTLPIKPITLVFGANSSGKSTIIHSLLLAHEAITSEKMDLDVHYTKLGGDSVDLGGFRQYVNKRDDEKNVTLEMNLSVKDLNERLRNIFDGIFEITLIVEFGLFGTLKESKIISFEMITDKKSFIKMSTKISSEFLDPEIGIIEETHITIDTIETENLIMKSFIEFVNAYTTSETVSEADILYFKDTLDDLIPNIKISYNGFIPENVSNIQQYIDPRIDSTNSIIIVGKESRKEAIKSITTNLLPHLLNDILVNIYSIVTSEINKTEYLGPLRTYPERHFGFNKFHNSNWKVGGGNYWELLIQDIELKKEVNSWLDLKLKPKKYSIETIRYLPDYKIKASFPELIKDLYQFSLSNFIYELYMNGLDATQIISTIADEMNLDTKEYEDDYYLFLTMQQDFSSSEEFRKFVPESDYEQLAEMKYDILLQKHSDNSELVLIDKDTDTIVSHRDVGLGISQVLPVIVSAIAGKDKLIAIEQPEIHLHPALQAELGDLFINSALGENKNSFILETHSEHLILRILRRIRETASGELPQDVMPIKPEDVQIVFIQTGKNGAEIFEMKVNEEGDFDNKWPGGFFEERAEELF